VSGGYPGTPCPEGIKAGHRVGLVNIPEGFAVTLGGLPTGCRCPARLRAPQDVIVAFFNKRRELEPRSPTLIGLMARRADCGSPGQARACGVASDITEDVARELGLAAGVLDSKVCAIDETWSAVRLVIRLRDQRTSSRRFRSRSGGNAQDESVSIDEPGGDRMPKTTSSGRVKQRELPETLRRSPAKAQRTFAKVHDSAVKEYGEGERAHRVAYAALKHSFEKRGDHWEPKDRPGPSDPRARNPRARENHGKTYGGVDVEGNSKEELYRRARQLGIKGRSNMSKGQLAEALARRSRRRSAGRSR
jgi:cation transport regulator ChaB